MRNLERTPPAKADIAMLMPPNKHAFTAKAVWADSFSILFGMWSIFAGAGVVCCSLGGRGAVRVKGLEGGDGGGDDVNGAVSV